MKKVIFITGSTDGIGKLAAIQLAKKGHEIYLHGRNPQKLEGVIQELKTSSNNENIKGFAADFSDLGAVKEMAASILATVPQIDVLINNAGIFNSKVSHNSDGLDIRMVVNYLAPYVLTEALMPLLKASAAPRILNLSSAAQSPVSQEALTDKMNRSEREAYAQSKLALTMWSFHLAQKNNDINIIAVNPGSLLNTKMVKEAFGTHWSSADKGASILFELAVSAEHEGKSGKYFDNDKGLYGNAHPNAYDNDKIEQLIAKTRQITSA